MIARLFNFHGGVKPDAHKNESANAPIQPAPMPSRLVVPLRQSTRATARCIVSPGQHVLKGERIGDPEGTLGTAVHAPTSGTVVEFGLHPLAHPSGLNTRCVVIEPDGEDRWVERHPFDYHTATREQALAQLRDCGIVGLGGATFPSHVKLGRGSGIDTLILNGAECEPWITCDDRLMRERAADILAGASILRELIGARRTRGRHRGQQARSHRRNAGGGRWHRRRCGGGRSPVALPCRRRKAVDSRPYRCRDPLRQARRRVWRPVFQRRHRPCRVPRARTWRTADIPCAHPDRQRLTPRQLRGTDRYADLAPARAVRPQTRLPTAP